MQNERITAIGQNIILPFNGLGNEIKINFFGNWRSVTGASKMGAASVLGKAIRSYKFTASYKPSDVIEPSLIRMRWKCLSLKIRV